MVLKSTRDNFTTYPVAVLGYDSGQSSRNVVHQLLDGGIAVALYTADTRKGLLRFYYESASDAEQSRAYHAGVGVWAFVDDANPTENMNYVVDGQLRKYQSDTRRNWIVEVPFREIV